MKLNKQFIFSVIAILALVISVITLLMFLQLRSQAVDASNCIQNDQNEVICKGNGLRPGTGGGWGRRAYQN
jgi:uncharacterized protein YfaQ (DUF2300 family)